MIKFLKIPFTKIIQDFAKFAYDQIGKVTCRHTLPIHDSNLYEKQFVDVPIQRNDLELSQRYDLTNPRQTIIIGQKSC